MAHGPRTDLARALQPRKGLCAHARGQRHGHGHSCPDRHGPGREVALPLRLRRGSPGCGEEELDRPDHRRLPDERGGLRVRLLAQEVGRRTELLHAGGGDGGAHAGLHGRQGPRLRRPLHHQEAAHAGGGPRADPVDRPRGPSLHRMRRLCGARAAAQERRPARRRAAPSRRPSARGRPGAGTQYEPGRGRQPDAARKVTL